MSLLCVRWHYKVSVGGFGCDCGVFVCCEYSTRMIWHEHAVTLFCLFYVFKKMCSVSKRIAKFTVLVRRYRAVHDNVA